MIAYIVHAEDEHQEAGVEDVLQAFRPGQAHRRDHVGVREGPVGVRFGREQQHDDPPTGGDSDAGGERTEDLVQQHDLRRGGTGHTDPAEYRDDQGESEGRQPLQVVAVGGKDDLERLQRVDAGEQHREQPEQQKHMDQSRRARVHGGSDLGWAEPAGQAYHDPQRRQREQRERDAYRR